MQRIIDSNELFGEETGMATLEPFMCQLCGATYNDEDDGDRADGMALTDFAGLTIGACCYGVIENEILKRMPSIITWYKQIVRMRKQQVEKDERMLSSLDD